ncbi:MAG TPA: two-component system sensor histidine kinase CreC [Fibrobacteria bacterium]|nr:two-component system sensor histidine kinase CreC [Fibrobacteria bacterium]
MRLRTRLFLGFFLLSGGGFYFLVDWILGDLRPHYLATLEENMVDTANLLASLLEAEMEKDTISTAGLREAFRRVPERRLSAQVFEFTKTRMDLRVYVTDSSGKVIFDSEGGRDEGKDYSRWRDVYLTLRGSYGARSTRAIGEQESSSVKYVAAPVRGAKGIAGVVTVSKPSDTINLFIQAARGKIVAAGLIAAVAVALLGMVLSALITRPIQRLTDYARAVRDGRQVPLPALGRSEIGEMGRAFEEMREALEGRKYVEQYVHTLTHELKSPMSSVRGAAELLQEEMPARKRAGFLANIRSEIDRMQSLVDRMLDLSALESRRGLQESQRVDLSGMALEVRDRLETGLVRKRIRLNAALEPGLWVRGEKFLLQQAFHNLLENAIAFSPEGGRLEVRVGGVPAEGAPIGAAPDRIRMEIFDEGPGIPEFAREKVFEKFFSLQRPDTGKKSSGLGLTIVHAITRLHQGEIRLENRPEGGLRVLWTLPASPA